MWVQMTQDEVKSVQVGQKIKINGIETTVTGIYNREVEKDYGFDTADGTFCRDGATKMIAALGVPEHLLVNNTIGCQAVTDYFDENVFEKEVN